MRSFRRNQRAACFKSCSLVNKISGPKRDRRFLMFARSYFHPGMSGDQQKLPHPLLPPHPPQQNRRRMIHRQLSFPKPPHPLLPPHKPPLLPPQQHNNRMIQRIEPQPPSLQLHPPQFVAAKSLIFVPPNFSYTVSYDREKKVLRNF